MSLIIENINFMTRFTTIFLWHNPQIFLSQLLILKSRRRYLLVWLGLSHFFYYIHIDFDRVIFQYSKKLADFIKSQDIKDLRVRDFCSLKFAISRKESSVMHATIICAY